jgi:hypothetical protein
MESKKVVIPEQTRVVRLITLMEVVVIGGMLVNQDGMLRPNLNPRSLIGMIPNLNPRSLIGMIPNLNPRSLIGMIPNQLNIFLMSLYTFLKRVGKVVIITKKVITLKMEASQARVNLNIMKKASRARVNLNIMNLNLIGGVQDPSHYLIRMLAVVIGMVVPSLSRNTCLVRVEKVKEASQARVNMKKASPARVNLNIMNLNLIGGAQDPSQFIRMAVVIGMVPTSLSLILNQFILAVVTGMVMMVTGCMT